MDYEVKKGKKVGGSWGQTHGERNVPGAGQGASLGMGAADGTNAALLLQWEGLPATRGQPYMWAVNTLSSPSQLSVAPGRSAAGGWIRTFSGKPPDWNMQVAKPHPPYSWGPLPARPT